MSNEQATKSNDVMEFEVDEEAIKKGKIGVPESCAIAYAIRKKLGLKGRRGISVDPFEIRINGRRWVTPSKALQFIDDFDTGRNNAKPFKFSLACSEAEKVDLD